MPWLMLTSATTCTASTPFLNEALGEDNWEVDTNNPLKLLTVIGDHDKKVVVNAIEKAGFKAEEV